MPPRKLENMTPEQIEENVGKLSPAWAKDYIRRLEGLTRALAAQLQAAQAHDGGLTQQNMIAAAGSSERSESPPALNLDPAATAIAWRALDAMGNASLSGYDDSVITYLTGYFGAQLPPRPGDTAPLPPQQPSVWTPAGITPPDGDYATVRVVDGTASMEPVADIDQKFEVRFADFYQARYGSHESTGGMRLLVIEGDGPIVIHPIGQTTVLVSRGGYTQESR